MLRISCKGKIHRARVTEARLDYTGIISIDEPLMAAANILPFELVHINSMSNAVHWKTFRQAHTSLPEWLSCASVPAGRSGQHSVVRHGGCLGDRKFQAQANNGGREQ